VLHTCSAGLYPNGSLISLLYKASRYRVSCVGLVSGEKKKKKKKNKKKKKTKRKDRESTDTPPKESE
jgi:hypothetical protein